MAFVVQATLTLSISSNNHIIMKVLPENTNTLSEYIKLTSKILFIALLLILGTHIVYPYISAHIETKNILADVGIPENKKGSPTYRYRSLIALRANCSHGIDETSYYSLQCNVNSPMPYWTSQFFRIANNYTIKEDNIF